MKYIDKEELHASLSEWKHRKDQALAEGKPAPRLPDTVGEAIITIANGIAQRPNFRNYTYIEEMVGDAIVDGVKAMNSFDPERKNAKGEVNPFGFLSMIMWRAFIGRITREKKIQAAKVAAMSDPTTMSFTQGQEEYDVDTSQINQLMFGGK